MVSRRIAEGNLLCNNILIGILRIVRRNGNEQYTSGFENKKECKKV